MEVDEIPSSTIQSLICDLAATLADFRERTGFGRGIAAPQIGSLRRVVFIRMPNGFSSALINPSIIWSSTSQIELWDDCFSFPDLMVRVRRSAEVRVAYHDDEGIKQVINSDGDLSELLQHEIDHLDGILAVQRAISPQALCTRTEWERQRRS